MTREDYYYVSVTTYDNYVVDGDYRCSKRRDDEYLVFWSGPEDYIEFFIDEHPLEIEPRVESDIPVYCESYRVSIYDRDYNYILHRDIYRDVACAALMDEYDALVR